MEIDNSNVAVCEEEKRADLKDNNKVQDWDLSLLNNIHKEMSNTDFIDVLREECKKDFFFFIKTVLQPLSPEKFCLSEAKHFKAMNCLWNADLEGFYKLGLSRFGTMRLATNNRHHNKKVVLLPRIHGKTQVGTVARDMWKLFKNPDKRILLTSGVWENSRTMLRQIKGLYFKAKETKYDPNNATPYWVLGDCIGDLWNEDAIIIKQRRCIDKTPSIFTAGLEKEITSQHFDDVDCDDLIGKENIQTESQIEKTKRAIYALTEVGDYFVNRQTNYEWKGTIWHYNDWYAVDVLKKLKEFYDVLVMRCWDLDTHEPLFPEKYTRESLEAIKSEKMRTDPMQWYAQWLNEPVPQEDAIFKNSWFQYYETPPKNLTVMIICDLALSQEKWSCWTVIMPIGVDKYGKRYIFPYLRIKEKDPAKIAHAIVRMAIPFHTTNELAMVAVEEGTTYNAVEPKLLEYRWLPLTKLKIRKRSKDERIMALQPLFFHKNIFILDNMGELKEQLITFPRSAERDVMDALAYHLDLIPVWDKEPPERQERFMDLTHRMWAEVRKADNFRR